MLLQLARQGLRRRRRLSSSCAAAAPAPASCPQTVAASVAAHPRRRRPRPWASSASASASAWQISRRGLADLGKGVDLLAPVETGPDGAVVGLERTFLLGYDGQGFEVRDVNYRGSVLALPSACFLWKPRVVEDITPAALAPLLLVKPPIEILVVGTGQRVGRPLPPATVEFLAAKGVALELMDTASACSTFNILNQEDRRVAGAFLAVDAMEEGSAAVMTEEEDLAGRRSKSSSP